MRRSDRNRIRAGNGAGAGESARKWVRRNRAFTLFLLGLLVAVFLTRGYWEKKAEPFPENGSASQQAAEAGEELSLPPLAVSSPGSIPDYAGADYIVLSDDVPLFSEADLKVQTGDHYSETDSLGRCGTAWAMLDRSMMPEKEREPIGDIRPSGWHSVKYPGTVDEDYLYNRSHLLAYGLTGQNDNEKNLITGTKYMNSVSMLSFELKVMKYLDGGEDRVLYRVTPLFRDNELVARGVEMEACSVKDRGRSLSFHVFVYNVQPGIEIDYGTGESRLSEEQ